MKFELTASAVLCAALLSGCSTAPTLAVPTGEWENFDQQPQSPPLPPASAPQPWQPSADFNQGPKVTVFKPNAVVPFTPPGSTPVKPGAATIVLPVVEKAPAAPAQLQASPTATVPAPITSSASTAYKVAQTAPAVPPAASTPTVLKSAKPVAPSTVANQAKLAPGVSPAPATAAAKPVTPVPPSHPPVAAAPAPKPLKAWKVSPEDKTIRETLAKWSATEGWTFNPLGRDYWTIPQDFDVVASDTFYGDFKDVVRKLIASTELTSTPLQPCFFSNRAVRVILINEECAAQASQVRKL